MSSAHMIRPDRLLATFLELVQIDSPSGEEAAVIQHLASRLQRLGMENEVDEVGNLIGRLAGEGEPLLLCAHVDHVQPCRGIRPRVENGMIRSDGTTVLGADDTSGVAVILELLEGMTASEHRPAIEVVFTVREEVGLGGSRALDTTRLRSHQAIVLDMGGPIGAICVQGPSQNRLHAVVIGRKAHAGVAPEEGINAIQVAAEAIAAMPIGRIDEETTANIGSIHGGEATNIVPDRVEIRGEARSLDEGKLERQTRAMTEALEQAAARRGAKVELSVTSNYRAYRLGEDAPIVRRLAAACRALGVEPFLVPTGGGSDANIFNERGLQTVAFSTGMAKVHTTEEEIALSDMVMCARILTCLVAG